jgi:hypothetical protein
MSIPDLALFDISNFYELKSALSMSALADLRFSICSSIWISSLMIFSFISFTIEGADEESIVRSV